MGFTACPRVGTLSDIPSQPERKPTLFPGVVHARCQLTSRSQQSVPAHCEVGSQCLPRWGSSLGVTSVHCHAVDSCVFLRKNLSGEHWSTCTHTQPSALPSVLSMTKRGIFLGSLSLA